MSDETPRKKARVDKQPVIVDSGIHLLASPNVPASENVGCVSLRDLIGRDDLERMVQINFTVDLDFVMDHMHPSTRDSIPVTVVHGHRFPESRERIRTQAQRYPNVKLVLPELKNQFGTHHTKTMLLFFQRDGVRHARVVVHTANLCRDDWEDMTQGVYMTPLCPIKSSATQVGRVTGSTYGSPFEKDLCAYLSAYASLSFAREWIREYSWATCKAILIGSVPGYHRDREINKWGLARLASVLEQHVKLPTSCRDSSTVVAQCSSVASLKQKWFDEDFRPALASAMNQQGATQPDLKLVYPTVDNVRKSHTGIIDSAGFLRLEQDTYDKSRAWLDGHLCQWRSSRRQKLMPHIKTYTRFYYEKQELRLAWFLITSANLSRAAWGEYQKNRSQLHIKSYELGVLFCPELFEDTDHDHVVLVNEARPAASTSSEQFKSSDIQKDYTSGDLEDEKNTIVPIRLPYDIPLVPHSPGECYTREYAHQAIRDFT
ncbi:tyrosyl-DNA phosphodiesterase I [Syncephalastrum racemosum]|uniref:Tyrosyl-DNA phosphodiesterase I n=1 Tax=Syncephalastrum racemosum TaxID=13706 RepID=A0A1X2H0B6_SYNRA|nr:tyrosyl-DNA phosphodiesterase I [Syncephalastrum racemosum]